MTAYYFKNPFATSGTKVAIPTEVAGDNSVSYAAGWTPPYEADQDTDPDYKDVPRGQTNQLFYQITQAIQQYQQNGFPDWISSADNGGSPYAYDIYAVVRYGSLIYENITASNTATPGADASWKVISGNSSSFIAGMIQDWAGPLAPANWAFCDGSALSRADNAALYANITKTQMGTLTNTSAVVPDLASTAGMYAGMHIEGIGIQAGTTILSVDSGVQITMSAAATASGSEAIIFFYWGNGDGATTFNIPDLREKTTAGAGGAGYSFGSGLGQTGGSKTHTMLASDLVQHTHADPGRRFMCEGPGDISYGSSGNSFQSELVTGGVSGYTSQTAMPTVPPTTLVSKIIRLI